MKTHLEFEEDIKEAKSKLLEIIARENIELEKIDNGYIGICPFCEKRTFYINAKNNKYHCLNCNKRGGPIKFVMNVYHLDFKEANENLKNNYYL